MTTSTVISALSSVPGVIYLAVFLVVGGLALMGYTIYQKGDVRAELSHGRTVLKLEAKERKSGRR